MLTSNRISVQLEEYLTYKRSLGFLLSREEITLNSFLRHTLVLEYNGPLTKEIVLDWLCLKKNALENTKRRKIETLAPFVKFAVAFDNEAELLPRTMLGTPRRRVIPYIYTEAETIQLMEQCKELYSVDGLRSLSITAAIGLLWSTGLRTSELTNLRIQDVDLSNNLLYIWKTKFKKDRIVPISATASIKLSEYKVRVNEQIGRRENDTSFFVTDGGKPLTSRAFMYAFRVIRNYINAEPVGYANVRLTDFRHTFACRTIAYWLEEKVDINTKILYLSTYLGHAKPQDTYWYLSATPEMLNLSCSLYEDQFGGDSDE